MREFYELINEYPWTTFLLIIALCMILNSLGNLVHGEKNIYINTNEDEKNE